MAKPNSRSARMCVFSAFFASALTACLAPEEREGEQIDRGEAWLLACDVWDDWEKAGPPFRVYGDTYYVGTCGIASVLMASDDGHVLIDGGSLGGGPLIANNVETLGFSMADVKILTHSHEHFDHVGGLADLQRRSGAEVVASRAAAPVLTSGQTAPDDPQAGMHEPFEPVGVDRIIEDGDVIALGDVELTAISTPGHSPGAMSWSWQACEQGACRTIVYMDSLSAISSDTYRFSDHLEYVQRFRAGLQRLSVAPCDVVLTPHPDASDMSVRLALPDGLLGAGECERYIKNVTGKLEARLEKEARHAQASE